MGKVEYFRIYLQKPIPIYFSGEAVIGTINYRIRERLKINAVRLDAGGDGHVHWTESQGTGDNRRTVYYTGRETYFQVTVPFIIKQGGQDLYLEPGEYSFPFQIVLPRNLPTSFECYNGRIRYSLTGTIDIPWAFDQHTYRAITVVSHVDLNQNPMLRQPYNLCESKTICCCCCKSGPILATLCLRKTGYVCGEYLSGTVTINNQSTRDVKQPTIHLYEQLNLNANTKSKTMIRKICSFTLPRMIPAGMNEKFENIGFVIPPVCPSSLFSSRVIQLFYYFDLNFDATGPSISTDMKIPLTIGTIPLREDFPQPVQQPVQPQYSNDPPPPYPTSDQVYFQPNFFGPTTDSSLPPPYPDKGEMIESDANGYIPQYPYFQDMNQNQNQKC